MLREKTFLITGGTGSFGHTLVDKLLVSDVGRVIVFSRDEAKQHSMQLDNQDPRLEFILGDIRNLEAIRRAVYGVDYIFHAAALKQVPTSEQFPMEFIQTNILGSHNLLQALDNSSVSKAVFLSTDKAVYPVNAMGMTKAMMEKLVRSTNYRFNTITSITRYGNVIGSRGSVIPQFIESIKKFGKVSVTDPEMTRFMMSLEESVNLVLFALANGNNGDLFVQKSPSATVQTIVDALSILLNTKVVVEFVGVRPGEKMHETLLNAEESTIALEHERYFQVKQIAGNRDIEYLTSRNSREYTSASTKLLDAKELADLLMSIPYIKDLM